MRSSSIVQSRGRSLFLNGHDSVGCGRRTVCAPAAARTDTLQQTQQGSSTVVLMQEQQQLEALPHLRQPPRQEQTLELWPAQAFPTYLQSRESDDGDSSSSSADSVSLDGSNGDLWHAIRREAKREASREPILSSFLHASILTHESFEQALAFVLAARMASPVLLPTQLFDTFNQVLSSDPAVSTGALADIEACHSRDPACSSATVALLYYKGYHAIQMHRIAHALWQRGQKVMALALQSRLSEVLGVDIHPAARFGAGIFMDHACGIVIGETAVLGNNVTIMQNVTLGGTGKETGDRHPKIADNVLIGADSTVLGNITVGRGALIAPGSLVLKPVPCNALVAGSPATQVGMKPAAEEPQPEYEM